MADFLEKHLMFRYQQVCKCTRWNTRTRNNLISMYTIIAKILFEFRAFIIKLQITLFLLRINPRYYVMLLPPRVFQHSRQKIKCWICFILKIINLNRKKCNKIYLKKKNTMNTTNIEKLIRFISSFYVRTLQWFNNTGY